MSIDPDVVVLCTEVEEQRLRHAFKQTLAPTVEYVRADTLLQEFDQTSEEGRLLRNHIYTLFARLRGKLVVRLAALDLIQPRVALPDLLDDWGALLARQNDFLREQSREGMDLLTIVVATSGSWRGEHQPFFDDITDLNFGGTALPSRCYLMSADLELGSGDPVFATDVWPDYVAALIAHQHQERQESSNHDAGAWSGLYAWRAITVQARLPEEHINQASSLIHGQLKDKLLSPDAQSWSMPSLKRDDLPENLLSPVENPFQTASWLSLPADDTVTRATSRQSLNQGISTVLREWRISFENYNSEARISVRDSLRDWIRAAEKAELKTVVADAAIRPEADTPDFSLTSVSKITSDHAQADAKAAELMSRLAVHRAAVDYGPRLNIAVAIIAAVTGSMSFVAVLMFINVARLLNFNVWMAGLNLALICGGIFLGAVCGVAVMFLLQHRAGMRSSKILRTLLAQVLALRLRAKMSVLKTWWTGRKRFGAQASRAWFEVNKSGVNRLVEVVEAHDLQPSLANAVTPETATTVQWVELRGQDDGSLIEGVIADLMKQFWISPGSHWKRVLRLCERRFLSLSALAKLLREQNEFLVRLLNERAVEAALLSETRPLTTDLNEVVSSRANLLSVNTDQGKLVTVAKVRSGWEQEFKALVGDSYCHSLDAEDLPPAVLAFIYAESKLEIKPDPNGNQNSPLQFSLVNL